MNCRRAQSNIALWAGNDLDETCRLGLQQHLETCPACREFLQEMQAVMQMVDECPLREEADNASMILVEESLWPELASRLATVPAPQSDRFNGWLPAVAVSVVCFAMVLIASPPQHSVSSEENLPLTATEPISTPAPLFDAQEQPSANPPELLDRQPIQGIPVNHRTRKHSFPYCKGVWIDETRIPPISESPCFLPLVFLITE